MTLINWRDYAACADQPTEVFFFEDHTSANAVEVKMAIKICEGCPVRRHCLSEALRYEQNVGIQHKAGIWGGMTPSQRHKLWRQLVARREVKLCARNRHEMTDDNVYAQNSTGYLGCKACREESRQRWQSNQIRAS